MSVSADAKARGDAILANAGRMPNATKVKNKQPAAIQITAEQILRESKERQEAEIVPPKQKITDPEELAIYRLRKRKEFEDRIRMNRFNLGTWFKYAGWEESQRDFERARSVYERALDVDYRNQSMWLKYAEMEMRNKHINHARNVWDRAVTLMPRVDQFWYKYSYMEEMLGNVTGARQIFERWLEWQPDDNAFTSYVKLEERYHQLENARNVFERYLQCHQLPRAYIKYAKWEGRHSQVAQARAIYERALQELDESYLDEEFFLAFTKFEEIAKEKERARVVYKYALELLPKGQAQELYKAYVSFEKQYGDREGIEEVILSKRRFAYEKDLKSNSYTYDTWFDYVHLEENALPLNLDRVRDIYERAVANIPPAPQKTLWQRYVYLWINYALWEELEAKDIEKAREVYKAAIKLIPHKNFTFGKVWILWSHFEVRQGNLSGARKVFGECLGRCPKEKVFKAYIQLELKLGEVDRCRILYDKYLQWNPENCNAWIQFAELETSLGELERSRAIFEMAIGQPLLDMPEMLWKQYIDFEISLDEHERTRDLFERLLERTKHVKVWISFAQFEADVDSEESAINAAKVYERACEFMSGSSEVKEERVMLLESWLAHEKARGTESSVEKIQAKMPKRVKKRKPVHGEDGSEMGWEEYYDYIFPEDQRQMPSLKILEMAHKWNLNKKQKVEE